MKKIKIYKALNLSSSLILQLKKATVIGTLAVIRTVTLVQSLQRVGEKPLLEVPLALSSRCTWFHSSICIFLAFIPGILISSGYPARGRLHLRWKFQRASLTLLSRLPSVSFPGRKISESPAPKEGAPKEGAPMRRECGR